MRFDYKTLPDGSIRPIVPVRLACRAHEVEQEALVDSGADTCLFDARLAKLLGIELERGIKGTFSGVTGVPAVVYYHRVRVQVGSSEHAALIGFTHAIDFSEGILGQRGFFDSYVVTMDYDRKVVRLT